MEEKISRVNEYYNQGLQAKDIARRSDENLEQYKISAENYEQAAHLIDEILQETESSKLNFVTQTKALREYYLFEANECRYAFDYKRNLFDTAKDFADTARQHIENALQIIEDNYSRLNDETKRFLDKMKSNWTLCINTIPIRQLEPVAKKSMIDKDYITALDSYRQMGELQDNVHDYVINSQLPEVYKRTEKGNYFASKASIAMSLAGVYTAKSSNNDYQKEILEQFLFALDYIKQAQEINPEQDKYKEGKDTTIENIKAVLFENKGKWFEYLTEFNNNKNLTSIMQQTDNDFFKLQNAKLEIEKNKPKQLILTFGFMFSLFIGLGYFLFQVALSEVSWYRFLGLILALPVFFTVIGAFALRATDSLKEENFLKLMELVEKTVKLTTHFQFKLTTSFGAN
jgi:hypothetical protein